MIHTFPIRTVEDAMQLILDQEYNASIDRLRSEFLFRGMPDASFRLRTSLSRNCKDRQALLEPAILRNFAKYAIHVDPTLNSSVWKQMIVGQHYGLPTRLLDWTHSSLIALHFATAENNMESTDKRDGVVWRIDAKELAALLPEAYRDKLAAETSSIFTVEALHSVVPSTAQYDRDMGNSCMAIVEPPSSDQRIINQYAFFSVVPLEMEDIEGFLDQNTNNTIKYVIDKSVRWNLRDILDQFNVSERIIYPGLDGLSKWIGRHYYVKDSLLDRDF